MHMWQLREDRKCFDPGFDVCEINFFRLQSEGTPQGQGNRAI